MLIEVLISSVLLALIVIATFNGFDVTNRATASERSHSQADALAQQDEDRLRSLPVATLNGLKETHTATANGTVYTITSSAEFVADKTATKTCAGEGEASYIRTTSKVTWPSLGPRPPVVETGIITPPAGGALLVKVFNGEGAPLPGMTIQVIGPAPGAGITTGTTDSNGCVIFAALPEGEYQVTTSKLGYVDPDGNSEPPVNQRGVTIIAGSTAKKSFQFDLGGALTISFSTPGGENKGDSFVIQDPQMVGLIPPIRTFGTLGTYETTITSPKTLFPFGESNYAAYAGTCEADNPKLFGHEPTSAEVNPGETRAYTVALPAINFQVWSGTSLVTKGVEVTAFSGALKDEGCSGAKHPFSVAVAPKGELHKGMSYGKFSLCVTAKIGATYRRIPSFAVANEKPEGTALQQIYLGSGEGSGSVLEC